MKNVENKLDNFGIIVVDMQSGFEEYIENKKSLIKNQRYLLDFAKKKGLPVIFLEYDGQGDTFPRLKNKIKRYENTKIFTKSYDGGFQNKNEEGEPKLKKILENYQIENLIITGINKCACVQDTCIGSQKYGYPVFTLKNLMNDKNSENDWYGENTNYFETHKELIDYLKE